MAVYMIIEAQVTDPDAYAEYVDRAGQIVTAHGGRYLARGETVTPLAGGWDPERIVIIEFDTLEQVYQCFGSDPYRKTAPLREQSAVGRSIVVEGCRTPS